MNEHSVSSIELRHRHKDLNTEEMKRAVESAAAAGMTVTIHGDFLSFPELFSYDKLFPWSPIIEEFFEGSKSPVIITFHPIITGNNLELSSELTSKRIFGEGKTHPHP